jgi:hypothetical protein
MKTFSRAFLFLSVFIALPAFPLSVDLIPSIYILTNVDLSQFDINGSGVTLQMFMLKIDNAGDTNTYTDCEIAYYTDYVSGSQTNIIYRGRSNKFTMSPGEIVFIRSNDFLIKNNPAVKVSLQWTDMELPDEEFKRRVYDNQTMPNGELQYRVALRVGGTEIGQDEFRVQVLNSTSIELISPGAEAGGMLPLVGDPNPALIWTSDLTPGLYDPLPVSDIFEARVYKARSGETMAQATSRSPIQRIRTNMHQVQYPPTGEQLIPGVTYYWEVTGFLKGLTNAKTESNVFGFKIIKPVNSRVEEVLSLLRLIYDESIIEQVYDYSEDVSIRIDGQNVDIDELRKLVQSILADEKEIQSTQVR